MLDAGIIPINLARLAARLLQDVGSFDQCVAIGNSAKDITQFWPVTAKDQPITVELDSRIREQRVVRAQSVRVCGTTLLVDDVAVTGRTLQAAAEAVDGAEAVRIGVGMAWDSHRLRRRLAGWPLTTCVTYSQKGGGVPAMNTLKTLAEKPEVAADYVARRLRGDTRFQTILNQYKEAV
ncbi:MAG: phosphoribosyltransferase [Candidatus Saccharimonadales bacterium]